MYQTNTQATFVTEADRIAGEILAHIHREGSGYNNWYVGITNDIRKRLFGDHNVSEKDSWYIYRTASSSEIARRVEKYFLNLGLDGGDGGGDDTSRIVYAYRITLNTVER